MPMDTQPVKRYLTLEDLQRIEDVADNIDDRVLIRLLRRMAGRINEVLGIAVEDIDFSDRLIQIVHEKRRTTLLCPYCAQKGNKTRLGKTWVACPKCMKPVPSAISKHKDDVLLRQVPVDQDTLQLIRQYIKQGGAPEDSKNIKKGDQTEIRVRRWLFTTSRQWAWQIVVKWAERAGFMELVNPKTGKKHHVSPHAFRHAFIIAASKGATPDETRILQEIVGHQNYNTTAAYRTVDGSESRDFYDKLLRKQAGSTNEDRIKDALNTLGATVDDPIELVEDLYLKKSTYYHPDKSSGDAEKFKRLNEAYELVMSEQKPKERLKLTAGAHRARKKGRK